MTYILVPLIADELMGGAPRHTALVISPLKALMRDQVEFLEQHNVSAVALMDDTKNQDVMDKHYSVIYASPEAAIHQRWRKVLRDNLKPKVCVLVFDEAHCISSWGLDFRPAYRQVCSLQSIINTSTLVLTATATRKIQEDIYETLGFQTESTKVIAVLPDRPNIFLNVKNSSQKYEEELAWIVTHIKSKESQKKILLYVRSINVCYNIYLWLISSIEDRFFVHSSPSLENRRVEMFHANTDPISKERILNEFTKPSGNVQVLISTVAFGMGINIPDVDIVVHWGLPTSCLSYWQEVGRCARDGRAGQAVCYGFKRSVSKCEEEMKDLMKLELCVRVSMLKNFNLLGMQSRDLEILKQSINCQGDCDKICSCKKCKCCTVCSSHCSCPQRTKDHLQSFLM
ncbi:uncharacterized protein LOC134282227 [Saccostrea cucullata]|uniref:uncharacterized protein LOC134282227 n=1 Tax=Saccostrea cuccullata TaxID=36930 RepID=UPI002ED590F1